MSDAGRYIKQTVPNLSIIVLCNAPCIAMGVMRCGEEIGVGELRA